MKSAGNVAYGFKVFSPGTNCVQSVATIPESLLKTTEKGIPMCTIILDNDMPTKEGTNSVPTIAKENDNPQGVRITILVRINGRKPDI